MNAAWLLSGFVQGLVGGVVTLVIFAARAAIEGKTGVTFADLETALAVGIAVGVLPVVIARLVAWRMRRVDGAYENRWVTLPGSSDRPANDPQADAQHPARPKWTASTGSRIARAKS